MTFEADIYQAERLCARIVRTMEGSEIHFDEDFLTQPPSFPGFLSTKLPYQSTPIVQSGANLHSFFLNLLPEGVRLQMLMNASRVAKDDFLGLLLKEGYDTIGDISVVPHGSAPPRKLKLKQLGESTDFKKDFNEIYTNQNFGTAIAGIQEKLSSHRVTLPVGSKIWPSAILKLENSHFPKLSANEHFFMRMAADCGIRAAQTQLVKDSLGEPGLLVKRFDRFGNGLHQKYHQEDGCQLCGTGPENKYSLSLRQIIESVSNISTSPLAASLDVMKLVMFSYMIGNADLHAKNISVLWKDGAATLSPAYDLLSTLPYKGLDKRMALKMDGKDDRFRLGDFIQFAKRFGVPEKAIRFTAGVMFEKSATWIARLDEIGYDEKETANLQNEIGRRREVFG